MIIPFGKHKGKALSTLPDSYLRWIATDIEPKPPATVRPENRENYYKVRLLLIGEASRLLRERRLNGVVVHDKTVYSARDPKAQRRS